MELNIVTHSREETIKLGENLGKLLHVKDVITLTGDLGAGKTTFVGGVAKSLNIKDEVISPTFNILKCYFDGVFPLYHIDAYRLEDHNPDIGLEEYIEGDGVCFIEWPNYIKDLLNISHLEICIKNLGDNNREFKFISNDKYYDEVIKKIK